MKNLTPRMALACVLSLMLPAAALGQKTTNPEANVQNADTYNDRELAKEKKGDLNGAMADYNQAIITKHGANRIFDLLGALQA